MYEEQLNTHPGPHLIYHLIRRSLRDRPRNRRRPRNIPRARLRHRRLRRALRNEATTRARNFLGATESQTNIDAAWQRQLDAKLALAHGKFGGAGDVVEGVGRHGVVVCVVFAGGMG
jgi:hypothetical protein